MIEKEKKIKQSHIKNIYLIIAGIVIFSLFFFAFFSMFGFSNVESSELNAYKIECSTLYVEQMSTNYDGGNGSKSNPYQIDSATSLKAFRNKVNSGSSYSGSYFILTNNIDLKNESWTPIGEFGHSFSGVFDGNGYTILNISLQKNSTSLKSNGLFGMISSAKIINLQLKNVTLAGSTTASIVVVGGLVGRVDGNSLISHVSISNSNLSLRKSNANECFAVGGLIGATHGRDITIEYCASKSVSISQSNLDDYTHYSGGIIAISDRYENQITTKINCSYAIGNEIADFKLIDTNYSGILNDCIIIKRSYSETNQGNLFFDNNGFGTNKFGRNWSKTQLFEELNRTPNIWLLHENQVVLKGVDNVFFELSSLENITNQSQINSPYQKNLDKTITISCLKDRVITDIEIYQSIYSNIYERLNFECLKEKTSFGYFIKEGNYNRNINFKISEVFGDISDRQGFFTISTNFLLTEAEMPVLQKYYDITTNSWKTIASDSLIEVSVGNTIDYEKIEHAFKPNIFLNRIYASEITDNRYEFVKSGRESKFIKSLSFKVDAEILSLIEQGYILNVLYTNGFMFQTQTNSLTRNDYWLSGEENPAVYIKNNSSFSAVNLGSESDLIAMGGNFSFVGWSSVENVEPIDYFGRKIEDKFIPWKSDFSLQIFAERANLTEDNQQYEITSLNVGKFNDWDFSGCSLTKKLILYPVWGGETIRAYTHVYSYFNEKYVLKTNYYIEVSNASLISDFYRLNKNNIYELFLKNKDGTLFDVNNEGFLSIEWRVAELNENCLDDLIGNGFGLLSPNLETAQTHLLGANRQTTVVVVLKPRTDIGISLKVANEEFEDDIIFKVNDEEYIKDGDSKTTLVYDEPYVVTITNLPRGYHLSNVEITNGCITEIKFNTRTGTCSFTVDFLDEIELTFTLAEGLFKELLLYIILATTIGLILISIFLALIKDIRKQGELTQLETTFEESH